MTQDKAHPTPPAVTRHATYTCAHCGVPFTAYTRTRERGGAIYHDKACAMRAKNMVMRPNPPARPTRQAVICTVCGGRLEGCKRLGCIPPELRVKV